MAGANEMVLPLTAVTMTACEKGRDPNQSVQPPPSIVGAFFGAEKNIMRPALSPLGAVATVTDVEPRVAPVLTLALVNAPALLKSHADAATIICPEVKRRIVAGLPFASTCPRSVTPLFVMVK